jgi:hypothetical protein
MASTSQPGWSTTPRSPRAAALGVDVTTTDQPVALHRELAATSLTA